MQVLVNLISGTDKDVYLLRARQFNHAVAYASFVCHNVTLPNPLSGMRIQGAAYTAFGDIRSASVHDARFIQVFFFI